MNDNPNTQTSASQTARIKAALLRGETLTPMDALRRFGCFRLGARIWDLRNKQGMNIRTEQFRTERHQDRAVPHRERQDCGRVFTEQLTT